MDMGELAKVLPDKYLGTLDNRLRVWYNYGMDASEETNNANNR